MSLHLLLHAGHHIPTLVSRYVHQERPRPMTQAPDAASLLGSRQYISGLVQGHEVIRKKKTLSFRTSPNANLGPPANGEAHNKRWSTRYMHELENQGTFKSPRVQGGRRVAALELQNDMTGRTSYERGQGGPAKADPERIEMSRQACILISPAAEAHWEQRDTRWTP